MSRSAVRTSSYQLRVGRGSAGLCLFSEEDIDRGQFVVEYWGPLLDDDQTEQRGGKYLFAIDETLTIDGSGRDNVARYINHSCRPNCEAELDGTRVFIYAKKKIRAGEELTYDYGKEYFDEFIGLDACRCGNH